MDGFQLPHRSCQCTDVRLYLLPKICLFNVGLGFLFSQMKLHMEKKAFGVLYFLFLTLFLLSGVEVFPGVEGRMCETWSNTFKGTCFRDSNCRTVCHAEGFPDGDCTGVRRRCRCKKPC